MLRLINIPFIAINLQKGESHRLLGSPDRPLVLPSIPDPRSGLVPIPTASQSLRPAGRVVLVPGAETAHGSLRLDSRAQWRGLCCRCCCRRRSSVVTAPSSSLLFRRRCSLVVAAPVAASLADPVAASSSRVPWTFGILGSLGMPFRRGRHLICVSRPIGSPSRHTPGRMRFSVADGRIRARRAYLPRRTRPGCVRHSPPNTCVHTRRIYADQRFWRRVSFNSR